MCGIAGFVGVEELVAGPGRRALLENMLGLIRHRGPDDEGLLLTPEAAIGMRRLSIIDLAGGHQPLAGCGGRVSIVFNGEIYNYRELRHDLEARGHQFKTNSDTETIVHAYEEHGARALELLRGMFVFALWDGEARQLFVARDRAGKKPLYYARTPGGSLVFGSELKSLLAHPGVPRETSFDALDAYLALGYVPDPLTIFRNVHKLLPGHHLTYEEGGAPKVEQYWDFPFAEEADATRSEDEAVEELRALLDESVRLRLISDVPLGAFLSGGVDSSAVVGLMARHTDRPVKTFSIGFREDSYNELKYARVAAEHFGTDHHEFVVTPDICHVVDELVAHFDEPFADSSAIPTYFVSKLAREHVTVALSGDGGDELFAGYTRYAVDRRRSAFARLPGPLRRGLMQPLSRRLPHGAWGRNFLHNVAQDPVARYFECVSVFTGLGKLSLYTDDFRRALGAGADFALAQFREFAGRVRPGEPLDVLLYLDSKTYLPGDILTKVDRMSMAASLEARSPLLDHKLMEFAARLPASFKMDGSEGKRIFKRAVRDLVPASILDRPKQGFGVPVDRWINRELRGRIRETLSDPRAEQRGYFDRRHVRLLLEEHERGRRDHSTRLWALLMLELWHRAYAEQPNAGDATRLAPGEPLTAAV